MQYELYHNYASYLVRVFITDLILRHSAEVVETYSKSSENACVYKEFCNTKGIWLWKSTSLKTASNSFLRAVRWFMEMKTLNPIILKELIEKIEVYHVEGSGKNKTQRIVIHYRFVGCLTIPEWYRKRRVSLESRSGVEINFLTTAV